MSPVVDPPAEVHLFCCLRCGRTDRHQQMRQIHYKRGRRCDGQVVRVRYSFSAIVPEGSDAPGKLVGTPGEEEA